MTTSQTRGKTAPLADRIQAQADKLAALQLLQAEKALGDHPAILEANEAVAVAFKALTENNRIIKVGPSKVINFQERAEKWQNDLDLALSEVAESRDALTQAKLQKEDIISGLLLDAKNAQA